jgi:hypothetical protein
MKKKSNDVLKEIIINSKEKSPFDPKVVRVWDEYLEEIPFEDIDHNLYGHLTKASTTVPYTNTNQPYYFFVDSSVFSPRAQEFRLTGGYAMNLLYGTKAYKDYWVEERNRVLNGYTTGGFWIPGEYYFYLNYCPIKRVIDYKTGKEGLDFPLFTSMDYYWFMQVNEAENTSDSSLKQNLIASKSRRMGFSFKNAAGMCHKFFFFKESMCVIVSEFEDKAKNTLNMCYNIIDFINQHTEFRTPLLTRTKSRVVAGAKVFENGKEYIKGKKSEILTVTLHNKPDAAAGYSAVRVIFEEAGMITHLKEAWAFTEPTLRSGALRKGIGILYGTGGDMLGSTRDFAEMFYTPSAYGLREYQNIYEDTSPHCGYFISNMAWKEGSKIHIKGVTHEAVDRQGNARHWVAELALNRERSNASKGDRKSLYKTITQYPKTPKEAFLTQQGDIFPTAELLEVSSSLRKKFSKAKAYTAGKLVETDTGIQFQPDIAQELYPLDYYPLTGKESTEMLKGAMMIYQQPLTHNGVIPEGAYIIGFDPYKVEGGVAEVTSETSLAVAYVMRTHKYTKELGSPSTIVASYIAREDLTDDCYYNLYKLAKFYNAQIMYENDVGNVKQYFQTKQALNMLASTPIHAVEKFLPNANTNNRRYGFSSANQKYKREYIRYLIDWLLEKRPEDADIINMHLIPDSALIDEMIMYNFEYGNFDRVSALIGCILYMENETLKYAYSPINNSKHTDFFIYNPNVFNMYKLNTRHTQNSQNNMENNGT